MSKINQIQKALLELDGGAFQKLADSYLIKKGYANIVPLGSVLAANKVKKGTPDSLVPLSNGKFTLVEYTTQQTEAFKKLRGDLEKCFDEDKTGIPIAKIQEIVFCHTSDLSAGDLNSLREDCETRGVNLNVFDLGSISYDLLEKFQGLARDYLGVEVDTGQIVSTDEFVTLYSKNKLATRLDTAFHFREEEVKQIGAALETRDLVIVPGKPGVGKTRLALECCLQFKNAHSEYRILCVFNRGPDLYEDLRVHFGEPGAFLILVDDANRISNFEYVAQLLQHQRQDQRIKVIVTVRDYAVEKIREASKSYGGGQEIDLQPLGDDQIKQLVEKEYGILNRLYLDRIATIAKGNPRLAIMAAEVAKERDTLQSIDDVSSLYDRYFDSILQDLNELGSTDHLKVAGIVAFFRNIDRTHKETLTAIEEAFDLAPSALWATLNYLHQLEMVDIYENEVARVSDQVLATYLFYLAFFKKRVLDFGILLETFFSGQRSRFVDALNPVFDAFDSGALMEIMQPHVDRYWAATIKAGEEERLLQLMSVFWFMKQTDTLVYTSDHIATMPTVPVDLASLKFDQQTQAPHSSILSILANFQYVGGANFQAALTLLCDYLEKCPAELSKLLFLFIDSFGFRHTSYRFGYAIQQSVVEMLWHRAQLGKNWLFSKVFITVARKYLHTHFHSHEAKGNHAITIFNFDLAPSPALTAIRKMLWDGLFCLYLVEEFKEEVLDTVRHYSTSGYEVAVTQIVAQDAVELTPFLERELSSSQFGDCLLVQTYLTHLERCKVPFDTALKERFRSESYALYELLAFEWAEKVESELDYHEFCEHKKQAIEKHTCHYTFEDYERLLAQCAEIKAAMVGSHREYQRKENTLFVFATLAKRDAGLYAQVLHYYLERGHPLDINCYPLVKNLIEACGAEGAFSILTSTAYPDQRSWLFCFYYFLPAAEISVERLNQLFNLYQTCGAFEVPYDWDFLLKYRPYEPQVVTKVTEILLSKADEEPRLSGSFHMLFNSTSEVNKQIAQHFSGKAELLKRAYFMELNSAQHPYHNGRVFNHLLDLDHNFIREYIDWMYSNKDRLSRLDDYGEYAFIWDRDDYQQIMGMAAEQIFAHEKIHYHSYFSVFFNLRRSESEPKNLTARQESFLSTLIERRHTDIGFMEFIFDLITDCSAANRTSFISQFVRLNNNFDDFNRLSLEPNHWGWSGSAVPMLQSRVAYLQSLIPIFDTVHFLKHKQHVERKIKGVRGEIEREKKRNFIGD